MSDDPYRLYRYFDAKDILLYVGISGDLAVRDRSHISRSKWMQLTAHSIIERRKTLERVKMAERIAIETEHPIFNVAHNSTPEAKQRVRAYLEEIGRLDLLRPARKTKERQLIAFDTATLPFRILGGRHIPGSEFGGATF